MDNLYIPRQEIIKSDVYFIQTYEPKKGDGYVFIEKILTNSYYKFDSCTIISTARSHFYKLRSTKNKNYFTGRDLVYCVKVTEYKSLKSRVLEDFLDFDKEDHSCLFDSEDLDKIIERIEDMIGNSYYEESNGHCRPIFNLISTIKSN